MTGEQFYKALMEHRAGLQTALSETFQLFEDGDELPDVEAKAALEALDQATIALANLANAAGPGSSTP
jgi:hypothetical protein